MKNVKHTPRAQEIRFNSFFLVYSMEVNTVLLRDYEGISSDITSVLKHHIDQYCIAAIEYPLSVVGIDVLTSRLFAAVSHFFKFVTLEAKLEVEEADKLRDFLGRLTVQAYQKKEDDSLVVLMDLSPEVFEVPTYVEDLYIHILSSHIHIVH
jgi:hypothetical protein